MLWPLRSHFLKHAKSKKNKAQAPTDLGGRGLSVIGAQVHLLEHLNLKVTAMSVSVRMIKDVREGMEKENCEMDGEASTRGERSRFTRLCLDTQCVLSAPPLFFQKHL